MTNRAEICSFLTCSDANANDIRCQPSAGSCSDVYHKVSLVPEVGQGVAGLRGFHGAMGLVPRLRVCLPPSPLR